MIKEYKMNLELHQNQLPTPLEGVRDEKQKLIPFYYDSDLMSNDS